MDITNEQTNMKAIPTDSKNKSGTIELFPNTIPTELKQPEKQETKRLDNSAKVVPALQKDLPTPPTSGGPEMNVNGVPLGTRQALGSPDFTEEERDNNYREWEVIGEGILNEPVNVGMPMSDAVNKNPVGGHELDLDTFRAVSGKGTATVNGKGATFNTGTLIVPDTTQTKQKEVDNSEWL